jgi:hypothetical protein
MPLSVGSPASAESCNSSAYLRKLVEPSCLSLAVSRATACAEECLFGISGQGLVVEDLVTSVIPVQASQSLR